MFSSVSGFSLLFVSVVGTILSGPECFSPSPHLPPSPQRCPMPGLCRTCCAAQVSATGRHPGGRHHHPQPPDGCPGVDGVQWACHYLPPPILLPILLTHKAVVCRGRLRCRGPEPNAGELPVLAAGPHHPRLVLEGGTVLSPVPSQVCCMSLGGRVGRLACVGW